MIRWFAVVLMFVSVSIPARARSLGLNDLSVLLPLPDQTGFNRMIHPEFDGGRGSLLPREIYKLLPILALEADQDSLYLNHLRVVAIRFDPCFEEGTRPVCRPQVRLVWQPVIYIGDRASTLDASIHTFHELDPAEWKLVLMELSDLPEHAPHSL